MQWDVFNGDADGICSLIQLRLAEPKPDATIVTGVKRDIALMNRVEAGEGDQVTALDISLAKNRDGVERALEAGAHVFYADHHDPGEPMEHPNLTRRIVTKGEMCTAFIIDKHLDGAFRDWAIVGAFGDNMNALAAGLGEGRDLPLERLQEMGVLLNYNAYGSTLEDLHFHPEALYRAMVEHETPVTALDGETMAQLREGYSQDQHVAETAKTLQESDTGLAILLPEGAASRRISGVWGNKLATENPERAHAVLTDRGGVYTVSIRAPIATRKGAVDLAKQFETGGGRAAAAGINDLYEADVERFLSAFDVAFKASA